MKTKMNTCEDCKKITSGLCDKHINGTIFNNQKKEMNENNWEDRFDEKFPLEQGVSPDCKIRREYALDGNIKSFISELLQQQREEIIKFLEKIEHQKWDDAQHCSCLTHAIGEVKEIIK